MKLKEVIAEALLRGELPSAIGKRLRVSQSYISQSRKMAGLKPEKRGRKLGSTINSCERVQKMRTESRILKCCGYTYEQIGKHFGVTYQRIQGLLRKKPSSNVCSRCGKHDPHIHGHHADYSKDETIPLCNSCHMKLEQRARR